MSADDSFSTPGHREAMRLEWSCRPVPTGTLLLSALLGTGVFSAVSSMWAW